MIKMKHLAAAILVLFAIVMIIQYSNYLRFERLEKALKEIGIKP